MTSKSFNGKHGVNQVTEAEIRGITLFDTFRNTIENLHNTDEISLYVAKDLILDQIGEYEGYGPDTYADEILAMKALLKLLRRKYGIK